MAFSPVHVPPPGLAGLGSLLCLGAILVTGCGSGADTPSSTPSASSLAPGSSTVSSPPSPDSSSEPTPRPHVIDILATGLAVPWGVVFLPDGTALVGERDSTRVLAVSPTSPGTEATVREVGRVEIASPQGEAGLLGLEVSPSFVEDHRVYAYVSTAQDNRVVSLTYDGHRLGPPTPLLTGIPNGFVHDGGRLLFGPDGYLYVSTGESGEGPLAQDPDSLGGKILRITADGRPAPGNPDPDSPVWSLGHRNVQGLAFDDRGRLWATEFGADTWDELNLIRPGHNYGWPLQEGKGGDDRFTDPVVQWRTAEASPSGLAFLDGSLWAGSLRGQRLWQVPVDRDGLGRPRDFFVGDYGRLRTVTVAPGGDLWVTTSNRDGRGQPATDDDRILVVAPS